MRSLFIGLFLAGLAALALPSSLAAQGATAPSGPARKVLPASSPERASSVDLWYGNVNSTLLGSGYTETLTGTAKYEYSYTLGPEDYYNITEGTLSWSASGGAGDCSYSGSTPAIPLSPSSASGDMIVRADGRYTVNTIILSSPGTVLVTCPGGSFSFPGQLQTIQYSPFISPYYYLSDSGRRMQGDYAENPYMWSWNLTSEPPQLEVELDGYDLWRPKAGFDEKDPGNDLLITARVQKPDGSPSLVPADTFKFELIECSKVPGITMNYPVPFVAVDDRDLQFLGDRNPGAAAVGPEGQWMTRGSSVESQATLTSFDWGGWGKLKVTALVDGIWITGHLKSDPSVQDILIPKRDASSKIADAWKSQNNASSAADDADEDARPEGDGDVGDGLTLYEEYRGFRENGRHLSTKPGKKDLFIRDKLGGRVKQGIGLFVSATKVAVHHELLENEFPPSRVINGNNNGVPHVVDQHGIKIVRGTSSNVSMANGGPGLPRKITTLAVSTGILTAPTILVAMRSGRGTVNIQLNTNIVAHEIGHCVNIWHHGEIDENTVWNLQWDASGRAITDAAGYAIVLENGNPITVYEENGTRIVPAWLANLPVGRGAYVWVGYRKGQHSGQENCFMRYVVANAYATSSAARYLVGGSGSASGAYAPNLFCQSRAGTGINAAGRVPRPQFGDAADNAAVGPTVRGSCLKRLCINDAQPDH